MTLSFWSVADYKIEAVTEGKIGTHLWDISLLHLFSKKFQIVRNTSSSPRYLLRIYKVRVLGQFCVGSSLALCKDVLLDPLLATLPPHGLATVPNIFRNVCELGILHQYCGRNPVLYRSSPARIMGRDLHKSALLWRG